jgi:hypothetical protein
MLLRSQRLRHDVCQVVIGGDIGEFQLSSGVKVPAVVEVHIEVFVPALPVSSCLDVFQRAIGVRTDGARGSEIPVEILVEISKPY